MTDTALPTRQDAPPEESALAPLRRPGFRAAWAALAGSQLVIWMNTVGAVTVIAALSDSATLIALVQTANSVPAVLLALVMGSMADIVDRRRFAIASQGWMLISVAALAALTLGELITPGLALALTFALGAGMATTFVIYQALTQDFVPRSELPAAVALNGVAINLARALGPALAGLIIAALSAGALFAVEAGLLVVIVALVALRVRPPGPARASGERLAPAVRAGVRFVRFSPPVRTVLMRGAAFSVSASALWALLPVAALGRLGLSESRFGLLMGCVGSGAILGATLLPRLRRRLPFDRMIALASLGLAGGLLALAYVPWAELVAFTLLLTGACWLTVLSSLNTSAQQVAPGWVRARTLAVFQLVMQGGLAIGSLTWGLVTGAADVETALTIAAVGLVAGVALARRWPLAESEGGDLTPAGVWGDPNVGVEPRADGGPVLITVEYEIDPFDAERFVTAMQELGRIRRRDGAYRWELYADLERPGCYLETFVLDSWSEHLRQHGRLTVADLELTRLTESFHRGEGPPLVRHMMWAPATLEQARQERDDAG
ncbi:MAG TPA: MFS transporter [Thermoleophilaceae bacterium]|nr:MFS transporter [Thermoleophilaceae bacterium]